MIKIETLLGVDLKIFLKKEYAQDGMSLRLLADKIARLTGYSIGANVLCRWFQLLGLKAKSREAK